MRISKATRYRTRGFKLRVQRKRELPSIKSLQAKVAKWNKNEHLEKVKAITMRNEHLSFASHGDKNLKWII